MNLSVTVGNVHLRTPFLPASGVFGFGDPLFTPGFPLDGLGGVITKGVTLKPREGNPPPRLFFGENYALNSIGLENPGATEALELINKIPKEYPIIVNVSGSSVEEIVETVKVLKGSRADCFEINLSCPNVKRGGLSLFSPVTVGELERRLREVTNIPLWFKIPPTIDPVGFGAALERTRGKRKITLVVSNTLPVAPMKGGKFLFPNKWCGYSGEVLHMLNLRTIKLLRDNFPYVEVVACGGIRSWEEALNYRLVGAKAVEIGRGFLLNPRIFSEMYRKALEYLLNSGTTWEEVEEID